LNLPPPVALHKHCKDASFSARYIGSLMADFHRNLLKGGIYIYPATGKTPKGKLASCTGAIPWNSLWNKPEGVAPTAASYIIYQA
jgi:fructose-1,6-bisphosphatase